MKKLIVLILSLVMVAGVYAQAQGTQDNKRPSIEEFMMMKTNFIIKDLQLSAADSAKFVPMYRQYQKEKGELMRSATGGHAIGRKLMKHETVTDEDYLAAARGEVDYKAKDAELAKKWLSKFESVLTPQQLFTLLRAEEHFAADMMGRNHRRHDGRTGQPGAPVAPQK